MIYNPEMTLRDARERYFRLNGFGADGGYEERWIKVKVWHVPVWLPNTKGRRKAVRLHDVRAQSDGVDRERRHAKLSDGVALRACRPERPGGHGVQLPEQARAQGQGVVPRATGRYGGNPERPHCGSHP